MKLVLDYLVVSLAWGSPWFVVILLWLIMGCSMMPQAEHTTRICIDEWDCRDFSDDHAEFLVDYVCEERLSPEQARELDQWSRRNMEFERE